MSLHFTIVLHYAAIITFGGVTDLYQPRQNVVVDERTVKSRQRSRIRQFDKNKLTYWGIKLWVMADTSNGYTINFNVSVGKIAGQRVGADGLVLNMMSL